MKKRPLISVVMPVYNGDAEHLKLSVLSILNQTLSNIEFIVIDDASSEDISKLIDSLCAQDKRITLLRNSKNLGISASLNKGIEASQAQFIARHDADDIAHPHRLSVQYDYLINHQNVCAVFTARNHINNNGEVVGAYDVSVNAEMIRAELIFNCRLCHPTALIRKCSLIQVGLYNTIKDYAEDYDLWTRLAQKYPIEGINQKLLDYRVSGDSVTNTKRQVQLSKAEQISFAYFCWYFNVKSNELHSHFRQNYNQFWFYVQTRGHTELDLLCLLRLRQLFTVLRKDNVAKTVWKREFLWVSRTNLNKKKSIKSLSIYLLLIMLLQ